MAKLARFRSLLTILLSMCYCLLPVWIAAGVTRCRISSWSQSDESEVLREQAAYPKSGLGCPGNNRRLLSIRAEQEIKLATEAIMESDGERFEKSIGKPAHPGRLSSRQVA